MHDFPVLTNIVLPVLLGILSSFVVALVVESQRRPRLVMAADAPEDQRYDPSIGTPALTLRAVRVQVANQQLRWYLSWWMNRETAADCSAEIRFKSQEGVEVASGIMIGRWSTTPQPVPLEGQLGDVRLKIWAPNVRLSVLSKVDIAPGESEPLDVAVRLNDEEEAFGWNNASYQPPYWRNPAWRLPRARYRVTVTIKSQGQKWTQEFDLSNELSREQFRLTGRLKG